MAYSATNKRQALIVAAFGAFSVIAGIAFPTRAAEIDTNDPVDIVVLVDESASLSSAAVRAEKDALKEIIGSSEIEDRGIRFGVLPFSSGVSSPRKIPECSLAEIKHDYDSRGDLMKCVEQVTRQRRRGSADTDFATAIRAALDTFDRSDATKVILLLTDGKYDPDGSETTSPAEQEDLDSALARANQEKVSMWALGFGKADKLALTKYVEATALGDPSCAARPEATIAAQIQLATEIRRIVDHATCTGRVSGSVSPEFKFGVSPLLSRVTIEVSYEKGSVRLDEVSVTNASERKVCGGAEVDERGRWTCSEFVSGQDGGNWKVKSTNGRQLSALITWNGSIDVIAEGCVVKANQTPKTAVVLSRADGDEIDFGVDGSINWPQVVVQVTTSSGSQLRKVDLVLDKSRNQIAAASEFPLGTNIDIKMNTEVPEAQRLLVRTHQISSCTIVAESVATTPSTSITSTSTANSTTTIADSSSTSSDPSSPSQRFLIFIGVLAVFVVGGYLALRVRRGRFPEGTELAIRNRHNLNVFDSIEHIGGRSKVFFDVFVNSLGAPEVTVLQSKSEARYVLTRNDEESMMIKSLDVRSANVEMEDDSVEEDVTEPLIVLNDEVFNPRTADATNADGRSDQIFMRVTWPISDEDFFEEDE